MPTHQQIVENKYLKIFGQLLHAPNLWHFNRYSVATAFSVGLFIGYIPIVGHMLLAAFFAIVFRANLPLSIALVWVANPFTMPPMYYFGYKLGAFIMHKPLRPFHFELTINWLFSELWAIYIPMLLGCVICGAILAILSNFAIRLIWRYNVSKAWKQRKRR
jgi:uncharacterized protein (DUF2062 family)